MKMFLKDDFLKMILVEGKKYPLPEIFKNIIDKLEKADTFNTIIKSDHKPEDAILIKKK